MKESSRLTAGIITAVSRSNSDSLAEKPNLTEFRACESKPSPQASLYSGRGKSIVCDSPFKQIASASGCACRHSAKGAPDAAALASKVKISRKPADIVEQK